MASSVVYLLIVSQSLSPTSDLLLGSSCLLHFSAHRYQFRISMCGCLHCLSNACFPFVPHFQSYPHLVHCLSWKLNLSFIPLSPLTLLCNELPSLPLEGLPCWSFFLPACCFLSVLGSHSLSHGLSQ